MNALSLRHFKSSLLASIPRAVRTISVSPNATESEKHIYEKLVKAFNPSKLLVNDISGGCGASYSILIGSDKFKGLSLLKQHRMVTDALKDDIKDIHAIQIKTEAS
ncbi:hypothetical protein SeMB42_g01603 [Synchytrium endobioticum]|uniref:BolA protein n=1 Tax=Synchytrium endobioticum TaxID=286115 RepID=A0A507DJD8_9FUNG|nr:hypothetical protein SeLEV6574_g00581 [Synchytrium endobioticum]TPX52195.1 hypothetical protein SeMB42_g01603 [Synchytrium endobioticum]